MFRERNIGECRKIVVHLIVSLSGVLLQSIITVFKLQREE